MNSWLYFTSEVNSWFQITCYVSVTLCISARGARCCRPFRYGFSVCMTSAMLHQSEQINLPTNGEFWKTFSPTLRGCCFLSAPFLGDCKRVKSGIWRPICHMFDVKISQLWGLFGRPKGMEARTPRTVTFFSMVKFGCLLCKRSLGKGSFAIYFLKCDTLRL